MIRRDDGCELGLDLKFEKKIVSNIRTLPLYRVDCSDSLTARRGSESTDIYLLTKGTFVLSGIKAKGERCEFDQLNRLKKEAKRVTVDLLRSRRQGPRTGLSIDSITDEDSVQGSNDSLEIEIAKRTVVSQRDPK